MSSTTAQDVLDIFYKKLVVPVASSTGNFIAKDAAELDSLLKPVEKLLGKLGAPKLHDLEHNKDFSCDVDQKDHQDVKDRDLTKDDSLNRYAVKDFLLVLHHHEDPIRLIDAPSQPAYFCVDEQTAFNCFPLLRMLFRNSSRPINSHMALHKDLFSPPADDDHIVFDPATTMVKKLLWENKILYIEELLGSDLAKSQNNFSSIKHETPETVMEFMKVWIIWHQERKMSFSRPGDMKNIETFIDRVLALAKYFGAAVNEIEDPKTMRILCWWSCHQRPFSSVVALDSSLEASAPTPKIWNVQDCENNIQAELNRLANLPFLKQGKKYRDLIYRHNSRKPPQRRTPNFQQGQNFPKTPSSPNTLFTQTQRLPGDLADKLVYDPDISVPKKEDCHSIRIYFQALMRSQFMKDQPGYRSVTTSTGRLGRAFTNLGTWAEGLTSRKLSSRDFQDLADLAVFLGVKNASYDLFVYQNNLAKNTGKMNAGFDLGA
ncbi:uncharacterized protein EAF02_003471 [Botrytis sinoallii]|uniref:uncharacterized protein n=1 Tax=Botrytis sinoallii TaxID=1463999 RepID=UPI00190154AD|nr:uncharacterized protein EAF02_003471 [Botrytis sinoallii]KAF7886824.1 hypothetical protein EAF02_003471 [Botrytis sinoallii]